MAASHFTFTVLALLLANSPVGAAFGAGVISDLATPSGDEGRALRIKNEQFWQPIQQAAKDQELQKHAGLYKEAEKVIDGLCPEHQYVRKALREALEHLRRADAAVLAQAKQHAQLASEQLAAPMDVDSSQASSFLTGGQNFIALAIRRFVDFGTYFSRLRGHMSNRREDVLPVLKSTAAASGNVLKGCHVASTRSFDVLKYDIYERDVAKTPEAVKAVASRIIDAVAETRHCFLGLVTATAEGVTRDAQRERENPSALVTRAMLEDLEPPAADSGPGVMLSI